MIGYGKEYGDMLKELPVEDWHKIAEFNRIVLNYQKLKRIEDEKDEE